MLLARVYLPQSNGRGLYTANPGHVLLLEPLEHSPRACRRSNGVGYHIDLTKMVS
jgi:hypothetical protein